MRNTDLKSIVVETGKALLDMGKIFVVIAKVIEKADDEGLLDSLEKFDGKIFEVAPERPLLEQKKRVCEHDTPEATCWEDRGHGFWQCLMCGTIKEEKKKVT